MNGLDEDTMMVLLIAGHFDPAKIGQDPGEAALEGGDQDPQSEAHQQEAPSPALGVSQPLSHRRDPYCSHCGRMPARVHAAAKWICGVCWHQGQLYRVAKEGE